MTQEELDALMNGDIEDIEDDSISDKVDEEVAGAFVEEEIKEGSLPFPATDENKMVHQLDDVTKESEEKASEIFDIIDGISADMMEKEENISKVEQTLNHNVELFTKLSTKFPDVETFGIALEENKDSLNDIALVLETLQNSGDAIMNAMDIMQYQDIHRQKIERVINVMRALSNYMNTLFEGKIDDEKRVASATHIAGDKHDDIASTDDIEALLDQFGKK